MAKVLSHVWSSASGSIGGITYFNGPHAAIIARARVVPSDPSTLYQSIARSCWQGASAAWELETEADQSLWNDYAQTVTHHGKQGNYTVTGRLAYMAGWSLSKYIETRGFAAPTLDTTPPVLTGWLTPSLFNCGPPVAPGTGFSVQITADLVNDTLAMVSVSGAFNKERQFWKGPWNAGYTVCQIVPAGVSTSIDVLGLRLGDIHFCRVKCVADDAPCRVSEEWFGRIETVTTPI